MDKGRDNHDSAAAVHARDRDTARVTAVGSRAAATNRSATAIVQEVHRPASAADVPVPARVVVAAIDQDKAAVPSAGGSPVRSPGSSVLSQPHDLTARVEDRRL